MDARIRETLLGLLVWGALAPAPAAQDIGFEGPSFAGAGPTPTESKPQSKLWFNDGIWWGSLWSSAGLAFRIHRLDFDTHAWVDTGVVVDGRPNSHSDALWDGTKLYIASHEFSIAGGASGNPIEIVRYSYDPARDAYDLDSGFPVPIGDVSTESVVIDKDSTGTIWAAWTQGLRVRITHTMGSDTQWSPVFVLPSNTTDLLPDDICSLISFDGRIGVAWSDQTAPAFRFSFHLDGAPDTAWSAPETADSSTDDHINLAADSTGRVFMAGKTGADEVLLLVRDAAGGWQRFVVWQPVPLCTRPIVVLDEEERAIAVYATAQHTGEVLEKVSSLDEISFPAGDGRIVMRDGTETYRISNPTSTKQNPSLATGLVVLAHHDTSGFYWHHEVPPSGGGGGPVADFSGSPQSGQPPLTVQFTDASTGDVTSRQWSFGDGATSTGSNPSHTYGAAGSYTVGLTVSGPGGSDTETKIDYIVVSSSAPTVLSSSALVADFTGSPRSGQVPLTVQFTDVSSGNVTSRQWDFGDGATSTEVNPSHTYATAGSCTVSLTVSGRGGMDTETKLDYIVVTAQPPSADFTGSPTSGQAPLTVAFTDWSSGSSGSIRSWSWDFGDGTRSSLQNPTHTFAAGTYTVRLTVSGPCGSDTERKVDFIRASQPPAPLVLLTPVPGAVGVNVITVTGATPGESVHFYASHSSGSSSVYPPGCPDGVPLALEGPALVGTATANTLGVAALTFTVPLSGLGGVAHFQAVDPPTCRASNAVSEQF